MSHLHGHNQQLPQWVKTDSARWGALFPTIFHVQLTGATIGKPKTGNKPIHCIGSTGQPQRTGRAVADLNIIIVFGAIVGCAKVHLELARVPAQGLEERINEFPSYLGFVVMPGFIGLLVVLE